MLRSALASLARNVNSMTVRTYATQPIQPPTRLINLASLADNAGAVKQVTQLFIIYGISTCVKLIRPLQKKIASPCWSRSRVWPRQDSWPRSQRSKCSFRQRQAHTRLRRWSNALSQAYSKARFLQHVRKGYSKAFLGYVWLIG